MRGSYAHGKTPDGDSSSYFLIYIGHVLGQCAVILNNHLSNIILEHTSKTPWAAVRRDTDWAIFSTKNNPDSQQH